MKTIRVKFIGFWHGFVDEDNFIINLLRRHYDVQLSQEPEYLFYSTFLPQNFDFAEYDCVRVFYSGENASPDFNYCDYAVSFDNITYNDRYLRFPFFLMCRPEHIEAALNKHRLASPELLQSKTEFANFVVGNQLGMPERTEIFHLLNSYKKVASVGTYLNNTGYHADTEDKKLDFQRRCRFSITFESVQQPGFVTEKILHGFAAGTVPIYLGDRDVEELFNPAAFINVHRYDSLEQALEQVRRVEEDPQLWLEMMAAPCFRDPDYPKRKWEELEAFLCHIVEQPLEKAFRRPLKFHAQRYADDLRTYVQLKRNVRFQRFIKARDNFFVVLALKLFGSK